MYCRFTNLTEHICTKLCKGIVLFWCGGYFRCRNFRRGWIRARKLLLLLLLHHHLLLQHHLILLLLLHHHHLLLLLLISYLLWCQMLVRKIHILHGHVHLLHRVIVIHHHHRIGVVCCIPHVTTRAEIAKLLLLLLLPSVVQGSQIYRWFRCLLLWLRCL